MRESRELETTENNLNFIAAARDRRSKDTSWLTKIIAELEKKRLAIA